MNYERYIRDGRLCWTLTSNGYKYLTWNLYKTWTAVHPPQPLLIFCADTPSYLFLQREGMPVVMAKKRLPDYGPGIVPICTQNFQTLNALKLSILADLARATAVQECLYLDGDIVIYRPFLEDLRSRLQESPLWFQCDERGLECSDVSGCPNLCTGLIAFRHGVDSRIFEVNDRALWEKGSSQDQTYVNQRLQDYAVAARALPRDLYPNGVRLGLRAGAYLAHYNHLIGNQKVGMMKRNGDWKLPGL